MKPNLGIKIPGMETNKGGGDNISSSGGGSISQPGGGVSDSIMNTLTAPEQAPQTPVPQWDATNVNVIADPNKGYQPIQTDMINSIFNPNTDMSAGVPTYNTPSTNQQGAPNFSLSTPYQTTPDPNRIVDSLMGSSMGRRA